MSPSARVVRSIIRLVSFGLIILSFCLYATDMAFYLGNFLPSAHRTVSGPGVLILKGLPFVAGVILLWKSSAMAIHFTKDLD